MIVTYHKKFFKSFSKLSRKQQEKIIDLIEIFRDNPFTSILNNHALKRDLLGYRSISAGGNLRLLFIVEKNYENVEFTAVGTHSQLY